MDGRLSAVTYTPAVGARAKPPMSRRARRVAVKPRGVSPGGAAVGADLGGSSKYSNENFEGRRGERESGLKFLNRDAAADGNVRESGDVGGGPREELSFLFNGLPTPGNGLSPEGRVQRPEEQPHVAWCPVRPRRPLKIRRTECRPRPVVLITASGLQGLALRAGHGGPSPEPVGCRCTARAAPAARAGRRVPAGGRTGKRLLRGPSPGDEQSTQNCETTAKGTGLAESAGKEDPVELDSSPTL
ncbi:hypothetical protein V6N13_122852 [Hibiscus sabdariffa]